MTGGLLQLASYGIQDEILIANPEITFFKTVFRKYTNFSIETFHAINDAKYGTTINAQIPKTGDILYKLFIKLDLPKVTAYYSDTLYDIIYKIVSNESYNYTIDIYNKNISIIKNLINYFNNQIDSLNNDKMKTEFLVYIGSDNNLKKLYNIYESSNLMIYDMNSLNGKKTEDTEYYNDRDIIQKMDITESNPFNFKATNFINENNYYVNTETTYILNFAKILKSSFGTIYADKYNENSINKMLLNIMLELGFDKINYKLETSFNYYNIFREQLFINNMPNEFLRQEYMMYKHGYEHIDDIMNKIRITGKIKTLDNYLDNPPKYLVFNDKTDPTILIPIFITDIFNYTPSVLTTRSTNYYDYTGYIGNINYMDQLIRLSPLPMTKILRYEKVVISKTDYKHKIININLPLVSTPVSIAQAITFPPSPDKITYLYRFTVDVKSLITYGNLTQTISEIINSIKSLKYITYTVNLPGKYLDKNSTNDKLYELPPYAILLIDPDNMPVYIQNLQQIYVYCKNTNKPYNLNNINILSPYIPILTSTNTFFDTFSTETDYKNQVKYLISKNKPVNTAIDSITSYIKYIFNIMNQFYNTSAITIKNTINKSDLSVNLDTEFNISQLKTYSDFLNMNGTIDNTVLEKIFNQFTEYTNLLLNSYQYISSDDNNKIIFNDLLVLYQMTALYKNQIDSNICSFQKSIDMSSIITFIFTKDEAINKLIYNDIELTYLPNMITKDKTSIIYKIRLYPFRAASDTTPVSESTVLFTEDQVNYIKPGNDIIHTKNIFYGNDTYWIRYFYKIIHIIEINSKFIDVYVTITYKIYKSGIEIENNDKYYFINQQISYLPNNKMNSSEMRYGLTTELNPNILYLLLYKDGWPSDSGNLTNGKYFIKNYYLSQRMSEASIENIWNLQQKYSDLIFDIISFPSYYYSKFTIDKTEITTFDPSINEIYFHDIFIMILYNAYKNIINNSNNNVSNIIGLIIQDIGYLISSFFKDPNITFDKFISFVPGDYSLEELATTSTNKDYSNYSTNDRYNLFNISSNSLLLSSEHIYNTGFNILNRIDSHCLNYIAENMIFNSNNLSNIIIPILTKYNEKFINWSTINFFINGDFTPSNIINNIINKMGQQLATNSSGIPTTVPIPVYKSLDTDPDPYNILNVSSSVYMMNNTYIYNLDMSMDKAQQTSNKERLLTILENFKTNLSLDVKETFDVDPKLINPIKNGIYERKLTYGELFIIINDAIRSYFQIYLYRSGVLLPMIDPIVFPGATIDNIIYLFCDQIYYFTDRTSISNTLSRLASSRIVNTVISNTINMQTIGSNITSIANITGLKEDPTSPDSYTDPSTQKQIKLKKNDALSYYRGLKLLTDIITDTNILITPATFIEGLKLGDKNLNTDPTKSNNIDPGLKYNVIIYNNITDNFDYTLLKNEIFVSNSPLRLTTIQTKLSDITKYTMINYTTAQEIINILKVFDFDKNIVNALSNKNIKLIYYNSKYKLSTDFVYIGSSINSTTDIIKSNISDFFEYNFINELTNTKLMITNSSYIDQIINLYNIAAENYILDSVFTNELMESIINISNTEAYTSIKIIISKIKELIDEKIKHNSTIPSTLLKKINNPLNYDQFLYYSNLHYYDKIFYLYNYIITLLYDNVNIDFNSKYDSSITYNRYNIFFEEIDNTFNINNQYIGPTIKSNLNLFDSDNNKKYFKTDYYISITLNNIHSLFNYFSKVVNDPINMSGPFNTLGTIDYYINKYHNNDTQYNPIFGLLNYISKYSELLNKLTQSSIDLTIYSKIINNPICKIIYDNINLFTFLLINIIDTFSLSNLINGSYSSINNQLYILSTTRYIDPNYEVVLIPNISTYLTDIYVEQISNNKIFDYFKGILKYNIDQSIYTNFSQMINDNRQSYVNLFKNLINVDDIGVNTQTYVDLYNHFQLFNFDAEVEASAYLFEKSLKTQFNVDTERYKTNYTYMIATGSNDTFKLFINALLYFKTNLSSYKSKISDTDFIDIKLDFDKYYSDIDGFYNYIINNLKPSSNVITILQNLLTIYKNSDATTLNKSLVNILNTEIISNGILDTTYKKSFLSSNLYQIVDLHNLNKYYINAIAPDTNPEIYSINKLKEQMNKLIYSTYNGINGGNLFKIYMIPGLQSIIINDYVGNFFTAELANVVEKNNAIMIQSNTKVSTKITSAIIGYNYLSKSERFNVMRLYNDLPSICGILHYMYNNSIFDITKLKNYPITSNIYNIKSVIKYTFYDIIMSEDEYNLIFGNILNYDFNTGSISILIYDKLTQNKYDINLIFKKSKLDNSSTSPYEFKLYRKTDLPSEYKFVFGVDPNLMRISSIELTTPIDSIFEYLYYQISIYGDNMQNIQKISKSLQMVSYIDSNNTNISINSILNTMTQREIIKLIDIIEFYSDLFPISQIGKTINTIYTNLFTTSYYINLTVKLANPLKIFNNLYYGTYLQTKVFLLNTPNYCANLTIFLYKQILPLPQSVIAFYVVLFKINQQLVLTLLEYIKYIETNINKVSSALNTGFIIETALKKIYSFSSVYVNPSNIQKQIINVVGDLTFQSQFIYNINILSSIETINNKIQIGADYNANFINELYQYNEQCVVTDYQENTVFHLMNNLFTKSNYQNIYTNIISKLKFLNPIVATKIENYVKKQNPLISYPIINPNTNTQKIDILIPESFRNTYYSNLVSMDEQKLVLDKSEISLSLVQNTNSIIPNNFINDSNAFNTIILTNNLLSELHKLIKINKQSNPLLPSTNSKLYQDTGLYRIKQIKNTTYKLYLNYPYNLIFSIPVVEFANLIQSRIINNQIQNNYVGVYNIYVNNLLQTYDVAYINFTTDFLISSLSINGTEFNIKDIIIKPVSTLSNTNIPLMYPVSNVIELTFKTEIIINKNFISSESVQLYVNNLNKLYLSYNYFIGDEQTIIKPKIISIGDSKTYIYLTDMVSDSKLVDSIELGLQKILSVDKKSIIIEPTSVLIYNTPYTLYNLLAGLNSNIFVETIINYSSTKSDLVRTISTYGSKYYSILNQQLTNSDFLNTIIPSIDLSIINSNKDVLNLPFISTYSDLKKNIKNFKFTVFNINDNINPNNTLIAILKSMLDEGLNEANTNEIANYNKRNNLHDYIVEYTNKSNIPKFSYTPYLADFIFDKIDMLIDGVSVDEIQSDYMYIYHNMLNNIRKRFAYNKLNLNDEKLLIGSETKEAFTLYIEIPLYFAQISGVSLPLISTLYSKIELNFKLKTLDDIIIKNKFANIKYKNTIKMTSIYSIVILDKYERNLFSSMRHEYLYERKIYNTPTQLNINTSIQNRINIPFNFPIKDYFYYVQLNRMLEAKQYYNYTFNYLLPELNMGTRDKLRYLQQTISNGHYDDVIYEMYLKCLNLMLEKIHKIKFKAPTLNILALGIKMDDLQFLYNNLNEFDIAFVENLFIAYFEIKFQQQIIDRSQLYFNSVERFNKSNEYTNMIVPFQSYNNMICGLQIFNFSLHPMEYQPSGYANFSALQAEFRVDLSSNIKLLKPTDILVCHLVARSYNIMRFISGIAGMAW